MSSELEALQGEHEEKSLKIEELKRKIVLTKHLLEEKKNKVREELKAVFNTLCQKYYSTREEFNALLVEPDNAREVIDKIVITMNIFDIGIVIPPISSR
ncbi:hypothetical protein CR513_63027, partial [Mucuna pruriens]